jgi:CheY-like chemotaxis protein
MHHSVPAEIFDAHALVGMRLLLVDDSDIDLDVTKGILEREGAQVLVSGSRQEALERIRAEPRCFDAVLIDVHSAVLDERDATRRIGQELKLTQLPIIPLTHDAPALVSSILRQLKPRGWRLRTRAAIAGASANASMQWPAIEGIDPADARELLDGDFTLFQSMLGRLVDEFSHVPVPSLLESPAVHAVHAGRMHKLRGRAGMLGARAIQHLAGEAEDACGRGDIARAALLAKQVIAQLKTLQENVARVTEAYVPQAQPELPSDAELAPQALSDLLTLLHQQSLSALDSFTSISPQLRRLLTKEVYEQVRDSINDLRFDQAAKVLEENRQ